MSGGEPSSIKQSLQCAARAPVLSKDCDVRVGVNFDLEVYGLVLQSGFVTSEFLPTEATRPSAFRVFERKERMGYASGTLSQVASANL